MKKIISLMSLFFVFVACNNAGDRKEESKDTSTTVDQVVKKEPVVTESYHGVIPCADCEGIEVSLSLMDNGTYSRHDLYISRKAKGPGSNEFSYRDKFIMHVDTLQLLGITEGADHYLKTDSTLIQLGADNHRITGNLAYKYVLKKTN